MTEPPPLQLISRNFVRFRGRKLIYFSGCDYFRMASHGHVIKALKVGVEKYGLNVAASRMTTGNHRLYRLAEQRLADFFAAPAAVLVSTGYMSNLVAAQALAGSFSHALLDEQCHPSLCDSARFLDCPVIRFEHRNAESLDRAIYRCGPGAKIVVMTDGMFARDGSVAPLDQYRRLLPRDGMMLVDDAHSAGVLGRTGKGTLEYFRAGRRQIVQTITLSKAFGAYGGAILCGADLRRRILSRSASFIGSTPPPLPVVNAALASIGILRKDRARRERLVSNALYVKKALAAVNGEGNRAACETESPRPIIAYFPEGRRQRERLTRRLLAAGIYPPFVDYPGGPAGGLFRFVISSEHTRDQLDRLVQVLKLTNDK